MKLFRGRNLEATVAWLRDHGWPAKPAERMAAFLTGTSPQPPAWRDLTKLTNAAVPDALRDAGWSPEDAEAAGEIDAILGGAVFTAPDRRKPLSPFTIASERGRDPDTEKGSIGTERSRSGTEGNGVRGRKRPMKSGDGD